MTRTPHVADELIPPTGVSPREALAAARSLLATGPGPRDASIAHQAAAIVLRDFGDVRVAIRELGLAARLARAAAVERLRRAPFRLILPSCESGLLAPAGADELLGLASALLPLGTAGIVASVAQVNDHAAAPLMLALHRRLRSAGPSPGALAAALRDARADACHATAGDPVVTAAGWSFIALGA
jgi:CHAT domain-containing protein